MKISFYTTLLLCSMTLIWSCKKKSDTPTPATTTNTNTNNTTPPATNTNTVNMKTGLNKKWVNGSSSTSRIAAAPSASDYVSFEFNATGNYYIIKADKSLISGTFNLNTADSLVTCFNANSTTSQYGTLKITGITDSTLIFKFTLAGTSSPIAVNTVAVKTSVGASSNPSTDNTKKIAKTWKVDYYTQGTAKYTITAPMYAHVVLTENGTYWTETYNGTGNIQTASGQWKWSDATQTKMCTSSTDTAPVCIAGSGADISFDTNGNLIMASTPTGQTTMTYYYSPLIP